MLAYLLAWLYCRLWLWPALEAPRVARRPPPIKRKRWAAVALVGSRLVGLEVRLVIAPALAR